MSALLLIFVSTVIGRGDKVVRDFSRVFARGEGSNLLSYRCSPACIRPSMRHWRRGCGRTFSLSYPVARGRSRTAGLLPEGRRSNHVVRPAFAVFQIAATRVEKTA